MGNRLRKIREMRGETVEEVAHRAGLSPGYLSRMETGERNVSLKNLEKLSRALGTAARELVDDQPARQISVVGFALAGSDSISFADGQGPFDEIEAPTNATPQTVAVEVRGDSLGPLLAGAYLFYDDRREPVTEDLIGRFCVVGLTDGRVVAKLVQRGRTAGRFDLFPNVGTAVIYDAEVEWAAKVIDIRPNGGKGK